MELAGGSILTQMGFHVRHSCIDRLIGAGKADYITGVTVTIAGGKTLI